MIPNGGRRYYLNRSQPPLFIQMVKKYVDVSGDTDFVKYEFSYSEMTTTVCSLQYKRKKWKTFHSLVENCPLILLDLVAIIRLYWIGPELGVPCRGSYGSLKITRVRCGRKLNETVESGEQKQLYYDVAICVIIWYKMFIISSSYLLELKQTFELSFRQNLEYLEAEFMYWLDNHMVSFDRNGNTYKMVHYNCQSDGPRPESYFEDFEVCYNVTVCVKDCVLHNQKYRYVNFICMFSWLAQFFTCRKKKIRHIFKKTAWADMNTGMCMCMCMRDCAWAYKGHNPWHNV